MLTPDPGASEPVVVFRTHSDIEASIVRGLLDAHGITASLSSDVPHSVFPLTVDGLGEVRITVSASDADVASRLITDYRQDERRGAVIPLRDEFVDLESALGYRFRDRGVLVLCDPRLTGKPYGKVFLKSFPPMRRSRELADVEEFFATEPPTEA